MTRHPRRIAPSRRAAVYGEPIDELLPALAAMSNGGKVLSAGVDSGYDQEMLSLSPTVPPRAGGSVRRAVLRSQAEILRRQADAAGSRAPATACQHCRESEAVRAVGEELQRVARTVGITGTTLAERALLLGESQWQLTAAVAR